MKTLVRRKNLGLGTNRGDGVDAHKTTTQVTVMDESGKIVKRKQIESSRAGVGAALGSYKDLDFRFGRAPRVHGMRRMSLLKRVCARR
jgi:hypothetical protein